MRDEAERLPLLAKLGYAQRIMGTVNEGELPS
jgi:hypothetical protein